MIRLIFVVLFYIISILNFAFLLKFFNLTSRSDFRDKAGDITTEVGYEEDSFGNVVENTTQYPTHDLINEPHVVYEPITDGPGGTF